MPLSSAVQHFTSVLSYFLLCGFFCAPLGGLLMKLLVFMGSSELREGSRRSAISMFQLCDLCKFYATEAQFSVSILSQFSVPISILSLTCRKNATYRAAHQSDSRMAPGPRAYDRYRCSCDAVGGPFRIGTIRRIRTAAAIALLRVCNQCHVPRYNVRPASKSWFDIESILIRR